MTLQIADYLALVAIILTVAIPFSGWLLHIDRICNGIRQDYRSFRDELDRIREDGEKTEVALWSAHREDVRDLIGLNERVTRVEVGFETLQKEVSTEKQEMREVLHRFTEKG